MTIDDQIRDEKLQYNINREAAKISALSSGEIRKYEYLTGEDIPANIRLDEDVLIKTNMFAFALRLQMASSRRLQDVFKMSSRRLGKTSSRRFQGVLPRRLQDVFKTS